MKFAVYVLTAILFAAGTFVGASYAGTVVTALSIEENTLWEGEIVVENNLKVPDGITLTIKPGTVVKFRKGAGLMVEGGLRAMGKNGATIRFIPDTGKAEKGYWQGISLNDSSEGTELCYVEMKGASSLTFSVCSPKVTDCMITDGIQGIVLARKSSPVIERCMVSDMRDTGISIQMGSAPRIIGCTVENAGKIGIASSQDSFPEIRDNTVRGCDTGISVNKYAVAVEGNLVEKNRSGISATSTSSDVAIKGNRAIDNEFVGIVCQQFSSPQVSGNIVKGNKQGIVCYRSSSPLINENEIAENEEGISCIQICNPKVTGNNIHDNIVGVYLELSSYAVINGNNFTSNGVHLKLGDMMSSDWENRVGNKPIRGSQAQNLTMAGRGKAVRTVIEDEAPEFKSVDATGNWWGQDTTAEMDLEGPDSDIERIVDYFDVKKRTYEGYEGEYLQDRVVYRDWLQEPVPDAGI